MDSEKRKKERSEGGNSMNKTTKEKLIPHIPLKFEDAIFCCLADETREEKASKEEG
jgi:hypothetical protein